MTKKKELEKALEKKLQKILSMKCYRIDAVIQDDIEEFVKANNKKEAIERVRNLYGNIIDMDIERITEKQYQWGKSNQEN